MEELSIIIVSHNTRKLLLRCLQSIYRETKSSTFEVLVVDNASEDGSSQAVAENFPQVKLIRNRKNIGFAAANNQAIRQAKGRYIVLLNSDTEIVDDAFSKIKKFMDSHPQVAAAGPRLIYSDGTPQPSFDFSPNLLTEFFHLFELKRLLPTAEVRKKAARTLGKVAGRTVKTYLQAYEDLTQPVLVDCLSGACLVVRREVIDKVGLLDENFFMYVEDMDWCMRMKKAGYKAYFLPDVKIIHHVGESSQSGEPINKRVFIEHYRSRLYFFTKHRGFLAQLILRLMMFLSFSARFISIWIKCLINREKKELLIKRNLYREILSLSWCKVK